MISTYILALAAIFSVIAFGGVEPLAFALVEFAVAMVAFVHFWVNGPPRVPRTTLCLLGILLVIPLLQLIPLPIGMVSAVSPRRVEVTREILSSITSVPAKLTLSINGYDTQLAILRFASYVLVFLLGFHFYQSQQNAKALMAVIIGVGIAEAGYGIAQYLTGWQYFPYYDTWVQATEARGTYVNRNHFAGLLEMILPFLLARILVRSRRRNIAWKEIIVSPLSSRILRDMILFAVVTLCLVFTKSRMGIVAAVVSIVLVTVMAFLETRRRSVLVLACLVVAISLAYSFWMGLTPVIDRFDDAAQTAFVEKDRTAIWRDTTRLIREYPWFGTGLGTYSWSSLHYQTYRSYARYEHAHSDYLEFAADIGIPAAVLLFGGLWALAAKVSAKVLALRHESERALAAGCAGAMVALLVHAIADFNLQIPANAFLFAWIAGTAAALVTRPTISSHNERRSYA